MATRFGTQTPHSHLARARPIGRVGTAHDAAPVVMGTGIVALAMSLAGDDTLSWAWLALAVIAWVLLAARTINSLLHDRAALRGRSRSPAALANVAATAVVGSVLLVHGSRVTAICMLAVAAGIEVGLLPVVLHAGRLPREGSSFLLTVALAAELRGDWWERFEKQFRAYASGSSRTATDL